MKTFALTLCCSAALIGLSPAAYAKLSPPEAKMVATVDAEYERSVALLERLVNQNSGTMNFPGVKTVGDMMRAELEPLGFKVEWQDMAKAGRAGHLVATKSGKKGSKKLLLIAHLDTVFEADSPFQTFVRNGEEAVGPGAGDDKGGMVVIVSALRAMQAAGTLKDAAIEIQMTGDEEDAGDPIELAKFYSENGADELVFLDISATEENRATLLDLVKKVAETINIPFTVGGGISSVQNVRDLLNNGADKVSINSAAIKNPDLINELATEFGSQCVVVAIDAKKINDQWKVHLVGGKVPTELDLFHWAKEAENRGAGEILFTSMNNDGTKNGFANAALSHLSEICNIPIIASGGAGSVQDFIDVFKEGKADAALAASVFHFKEIEINTLKNELQENNISIRL